MSPPTHPSTVPFDALYEHAPCGLLLTETDGTIRRANATFCRWAGHPAESLVDRRRIQDLLTVGARVFHQTHWAPLLHMQGSVAEIKLDVVHHDGHTLPMLLNAVRRRHGDRDLDELSVVIVADRHKYERELLLARRNAETALERQRESQRALELAEARLRLALASGQLHVWDIGSDGGERRYDESVAVLLGLPAPAPVDAQRFLDAIVPEDREVDAAAMRSALDPSRGIYHATYRLAGADGRLRIVQSSGRAFFDERGRLLHFVGVLQDVTEMSEQRAQAENRASFAEQMVGIVSHDLRNPLSAILMSAHAMGRGELSTTQMRALSRIVSSTNRAQRLIADLLDFTQARVGSGLSVTLQTVDLHALVGQAIDETASAFPGREVVHECEGSGACEADPDRLAQLIGNLLANALTYGAAGQPVTLTSRIGADRFELVVHNAGEPIPPAVIERLFEPMTRGAPSISSLRSVGLGLFIVREIARAHRGEVEVASSAAEGTRFTVRCPRGLPV